VNVQLRLLDKADKEILKLPRAVKGAIYDFQRKFREDPSSHGLQFKQLEGNSRLYSARVTDAYRALLLKVSGTEYLLVAVKPRGEAYENLDRYAYQVNPVSGGIEFMDIVDTEEAAVPTPIPADQPIPLFAAYSAEQLLGLGVAEPLLPLIAKITTEDELLGLTEYAPQLTAEVLLALHDGLGPDEVLEQVTAPVRADEPVDVADYEKAMTRPATLVTTDDTALQAVLAGDFARWQVFLHPLQRKVVERSYNGPARVSGGPGTGKTIVALHRVKYLVDRLPPGEGRDVLFTTFNKSLAADLRSRLLELAGGEILQRVEVVNIDSLASKVVAEAEPGMRRHWIDDSRAVDMWRDMLFELGEGHWDAQFLQDEWSQVVLGQALSSRDEYFRARRAGRGKTLNRVQRAAVWQLIEQFTKRLTERNLWTFRQVAAHAALIEKARAPAGGHRYRHVVVDEAQDLSPAHWMLLRAMAAPGPDDMFLAGDTHQRIYDSYVSLGSLGIAIRGRSTRLTLSYRSTHEILAVAEGLLGSEEWDDLDGGSDSLEGYRSVLRGPRPQFHAAGSWQEELAGILRQVKEWEPTDGTTVSIGVAVPERRLIPEVERYLTEHGVPAASIGADGPRKPDAVHVGTLHRFKGLEYQRMIVAYVSDGVIPSARIEGSREGDPLRYQREIKQARSLLFVAATRARDSLMISWHGQPSPFLPAGPDGALHTAGFSCASGAGGGWVIVLAAVTASAIDNVSFGDGYEAFMAYDERGVPPGALAFVTGWAVGLAAVIAGIAACRSVIAAWAVKVTSGPSSGRRFVSVEPGDLP
jgi:superfamily I DNA/RNA helicase